jgi:hypothetical protein
MDRKSKKATTSKDTLKEKYLKIPYHILNIENLDLREKVLLAHIYSFGQKGCWQSNATLAKIFMTSPRTIKRWLAKIIKAGKVQIKSAKGYYRTIWAKSHPDVREAAVLYYRGQKVENLQGQNCPAPQDKNDPVSGTNSVLSPGQNCPTTNNTTIKDTTGKTIAPPSPLPAGGQAPAALVERSEAANRKIEQFGKRFGKTGRSKKMSAEDEQKRRLYLNKQLAEMET